MDGKLDDWDGAFVTPLHVGHPDFANRGGQFLFLWDERNLYVGLRCLDQKPAHIGPDNQIWNGDAVEFYLDTRRGEKLGAKEFGPGTLHCFYTPFTKTENCPKSKVLRIAKQKAANRIRNRIARFLFQTMKVMLPVNSAIIRKSLRI